MLEKIFRWAKGIDLSNIIDLNLSDIDKNKIYVLDEAGNSLDEENKSILFKQLEKIAKQRLVILVSHRIGNYAMDRKEI